jgi:hypothetical protein
MIPVDMLEPLLGLVGRGRSLAGSHERVGRLEHGHDGKDLKRRGEGG